MESGEFVVIQTILAVLFFMFSVFVWLWHRHRVINNQPD